MTIQDPVETDSSSEASFLETALRLGGKAEEEARSTGAVDRADQQVEALFAERYQTAASPVHRAVWDNTFPTELFLTADPKATSKARGVVEDSLALTRKRVENSTLLGPDGRISEDTLADLGRSGYWGMLVSEEYGGVGASFAVFSRLLTKMATIDPTVALLASVHGCIGAVDPLRTFGSPDQKKRYLPRLASGQSLSGFALTEPAAGSDLTALRTTAVLDGDDYVVNGEKLFITNAIPGRTIALVCRIDGRPQVLIIELPEEDDDSFKVSHYGLYALRHTHNNGLIFRDFRVPRENLLVPTRGDGLTIAYHGLNLGRVSLCAAAGGTLRRMLASMLPWTQFRRTYGTPIAARELIQHRIGRLASLIVGCDALSDWCSRLLDEGYRGELECIVAKIFGSEALKEGAVELLMKTHGGRSFLEGHVFGDNIYDFLAPSIYEGEGEMLAMAFFKSLVKEHSAHYFEPMTRAMTEAGLREINPFNPKHAWAIRSQLPAYLSWQLSQRIPAGRTVRLPSGDPRLTAHARFAAERLQACRLQLDGMMTRYRLTLADKQCAVSDMSQVVQNLVVMVVTSLWAEHQANDLSRTAADALCRALRHRILGERLSERYYEDTAALGRAILNGGFESFVDSEPGSVLMSYQN